MVEQISSSPLEFIPQKPIKENIGINELIAGKSLDINLLNKLLNKEKDKEKQLSLLNYIETNNLINADSLKIIQNLLKIKAAILEQPPLEYFMKITSLVMMNYMKSFFKIIKMQKLKQKQFVY